MTITTAEERQAASEVAVPERLVPDEVPDASPPDDLVAGPLWRWADDDESAETPPERRSWWALFAWAKVTGGW